MIGPDTTIDASEASTGGAIGLFGAGPGAAFVTEGVDALSSPHPAARSAALRLIANKIPRMPLLRIATTPASTIFSRTAIKMAAGKAHTPPDTIQPLFSRALPYPCAAPRLHSLPPLENRKSAFRAAFPLSG